MPRGTSKPILCSFYSVSTRSLNFSAKQGWLWNWNLILDGGSTDKYASETHLINLTKCNTQSPMLRVPPGARREKNWVVSRLFFIHIRVHWNNRNNTNNNIPIPSFALTNTKPSTSPHLPIHFLIEPPYGQPFHQIIECGNYPNKYNS